MNKYLDKIYQEEPGSNFRQDGKNYDINTIFKRVHNKPVKKISVSKLKWVLNYDTPDPIRKERADLNAPILVSKWKGKLVASDGLHRLAKAVEQGVKELPAKEIDDEDLEAALI